MNSIKMDLTNYYNQQRLVESKTKFKRIFFYHICGTGMGAAACLLKDAGFVVEGGDHNYGPPMSDYLQRSGIKCYQLDDIDGEFLKGFDLIVVGNIVAGRGDTARMIEQLGVPFASFPAVLGAFILSSIPNVVGLAGTHGKTTTTYLALQVFRNLGENPGHLVGGVIEGEESAAVGEGKYFFIESDEYETAYFEKFSKFRNYSLNHLVLTSLEFDHAEFFADIEAIKEQFNYILPTLQGQLIFNALYSAIRDLKYDGDVIWYGVNQEHGPYIMHQDSKGSQFVIQWQDKELVFKTNLIGRHNIENLSAVILFALSQGFKYQDVQRAVSNLSLVKRRQEERGYYRGLLVIDDFAHHPRAVDVTLEGLRVKYSDKKMLVVFGASSATARSNIFQQEFAKSLLHADEVIVIEPERNTTVKGARNLDCNFICQFLQQQGISANLVRGTDEIIAAIDKFVESVDNPSKYICVVLSNSNCSGLWESRFVENIN